ncbi:3-carboxy-cis,cis-muconate cycloisomerase [Phyllobacterium myrsinacearum]|uniref:3-carboxy-cis,cis-muconate cycloisomerase n=1 Tax=Phyllobacterium myrsinacearum TaxID=28101 RepID=A0A839EMV7_9HYPH|nr:3-carboxy-cis,cis-muconate cycloisomerase [Phyllobacterium myrsinacearum]MBA8881923.1 3-carboxy-cis,cis-muconate cycloisomerase [Phyllobacterium myrsinacearum]
MSISPFDHPFLSGLLGTQAATDWFSASVEIAAMLDFEAALAQAAAEEGVISSEAAGAIALACQSFEPDMAALEAASARDGVVVPELVRQLRATIAGEYRNALHFGATSQDVIDSSLMIRLKPVVAYLRNGLGDVIAGLDHLGTAFGPNNLMGHTRMQAAIPITVRDRIDAWRAPLLRDTLRLAFLMQSFPALQFGGAAGTLEKLGPKAGAVRRRLAIALDLHDEPQWHSQRDRIADFASFLSLVTGSLGKIGQDIALLAQSGDEISLSRGGGSSAMPHKQNPVQAELLVTLGRYNATQLSGMHQALVHEQERSGSAWTLEWLILPSMVTATATSLRTTTGLLASITGLGNANGAGKS